MSRPTRPGLRNTCQRITAELRAGADLSTAMETCPKAFSPLYISMVRAGEASGMMDIILERLADYQEASQALSREIRSAMTYPVISLTLVLGITAFLMLGVVPTFKQVFEGLNSELPALTAFVLGVSDFMRAQWLAIFGGLFGIIFALVTVQEDRAGSADVRQALAARTGVRTAGEEGRPGALLAHLRDPGALRCPDHGDAGHRLRDGRQPRRVPGSVDASKDAVRNGQPLSEPLGKSKVFPPMVVRMIAIGERTGALESLLEKIAEFYDAQVKAAIKALTSLIEPILITFMGVIVGGVVLSVFLPILDVIGQLGGNG